LGQAYCRLPNERTAPVDTVDYNPIFWSNQEHHITFSLTVMR